MKTNVNKLGGDFFNAKTIKVFFGFFFEQFKDEKTLFIVSAMKGITRLLRLIVLDKTEKNVDDEFIELRIQLALNEFQRVHMNLIYELFLGDFRQNAISDFENTFSKLKESIDTYKFGHNKEKFYALILKFGELSSSQILSNYVKSTGVKNILFDARDYVVTKGSHSFKDAEILEVKNDFEKLFSRSKILVSQGFIAKNIKGEDTVLGFDGSDYSAAKFANALVETDDQNVSLTLWKKVRGVFTKDPNRHSDAKFISDITRVQYVQNTKSNNSYVIRPDSVLGLNLQVDVYVRSFEVEYLYDVGTLIHN